MLGIVVGLSSFSKRSTAERVFQINSHMHLITKINLLTEFFMLFAKKMQVNLPKMDMPVNFSYLWGRNFNWAKSPNSRSVLIFIKVSHIFKSFYFNPIKKNYQFVEIKNRNILTNLPQSFLYYGSKLLNWPVIHPCAGIIAIHRKGMTTLHAKKIKKLVFTS